MNARVRTIARLAATAALTTTACLGMYGIGLHQGTTTGQAQAAADARQLAQVTAGKAAATERARTYCAGCTVRVTTWHDDDAHSIDTWDTFPDGYRQQSYAWSDRDLAGYTTVNLAAR